MVIKTFSRMKYIISVGCRNKVWMSILYAIIRILRSLAVSQVRIA